MGVPAGSRPVRGVRSWVRSRVLRHDAKLESPLSPEDVAARLASSLSGPLRGVRVPFAITPGGPFRGSVRGWMVRAWAASGVRNSWTWQFEGVIYARGDGGTVLAGTVGPGVFIPAFSCIWAGGVGLFLLAGVVGSIGELATGRSVASAPLALLPLVMLAFFVGITEVGSRMGAAGWRRLAAWLQTALEASGPWEEGA